MSWTAEGLEAHVKAHGVTYVDRKGDKHEYSGTDFIAEAGDADWLLKNGETVEHVYSRRENEHWVNIFKIGDQYFRTMGEYDSWNGTTWDYAEIEEVRPVEKTVVKYERVTP